MAGCGGSAARDSYPAVSESAGGDVSVNVDPGTAPTTTATTTDGSGGEPSAPIADWDAMNLEMVDLDGQFESELSAGNCDGAGDLRDRICQLSERICELADQTEDPLTEQRCEDGTARCASARERVADSCD